MKCSSTLLLAYASMVVSSGWHIATPSFVAADDVDAPTSFAFADEEEMDE